MEFLRRVNDRIPSIFTDIIRNYGFNYMRLDSTVSALYKSEYAFIFSVDRDYVDLNYIRKEDNKIIKYWIQGFVIIRLGDEPVDKLVGDDLETKLTNYLFVYEKSLKTKCESILLGEMDWVSEFKKTPMCVIRELNMKEYNKYKDVLSV